MKHPSGRGIGEFKFNGSREKGPEGAEEKRGSESRVPTKFGDLFSVAESDAVRLGSPDSVSALRGRFDAESSLLGERVPSWIFYLADVVLMGLVIGMIVRSPGALSRSEAGLCLGLVFLAALVGIWPWLRNTLYCDRVGESKNLPDWVIARGVRMGEDSKTMVIHLRKPYVVVEVIETSWNDVNVKPYWIDGPPNLPPGGVKMLLEEASQFYRQDAKTNALSQERLG